MNVAPTTQRESVRSRVLGSLPLVVRTALAATLCLVVAPGFGIREAYWSAISCIIVMQSEFAATLTAARDRLVGTAIGGVIGWGCAVLWGGDVVFYAVAVACALLLCQAIGLGNAGRISGVTVSILTLLPHQGPVWLMSLHRLLGVGFGVVVGLAVALGSARIAHWFESRRARQPAPGPPTS